MQNTERETLFTSIEAMGEQVGPHAERQLETAFREMIHHPSLVSNERFMLYVTGEPHPFGNLAVVSRLDDVAGTQDAAKQLVESGAPAAVAYVGCAVAEEVDAVLTGAGFVRHDHMPAMAVDIDALQCGPLPEEYRFVRIADREEECRAWSEALAIGYELPQPVANVFAPNPRAMDLSPDAAVQFFAVMRDEKCVGTSLLYLKDGLAGIYCVATIPDERGQGLGAYATADPLRRAREVGYGIGVLQSSEAGHSVYQRLGFKEYGGIPLYVRIPES